MYEFIQGILKEKEPNRIVVECSGMGYRLAIPLSTYTRLPSCGTTVHLYLSQIVREDAHTLYAFLLKGDRDLFEHLLSISGIGPKTAATIIGHMDANAFQQAISTADVRLLSKIPGIGKKTAERLVIEMRDACKQGKKSFSTPLPTNAGSLASDATNALIHLGYNALDAQKAVSKALDSQKKETDLGQLITSALQQI